MTPDPAKGVWLLPSRRRPHNLHRIFASMVAAHISTPGLVLIQKSDFDDLREQYESITLPPGWDIFCTEGESQGDKLRETESFYHAADWIGLIGDDQVIKTEHWDLKLLEQCAGWNVVSCADNWISNAPTKHWGMGRFAGSPIFGGELFRTLGWIFLPGSHQIFLDDIYEELGFLTGCWTRRLDVVVDHLHYANGLAQKDETYARGYDHYGVIDNGIWHEWRASGQVGRDAEKIRAMMKRMGAG